MTSSRTMGRRRSPEVRVAVLIGLSVVVPSLLLGAFGVQALQSQYDDARERVREDLEARLRSEIVDDVVDRVDEARDAAVALWPSFEEKATFDEQVREFMLGRKNDVGPFEDAYLVTFGETRIWDTRMRVVRAERGDAMTVVIPIDEDGFREIGAKGKSPGLWRDWAEAHPLAIDHEGYPLELGARCAYAVSLAADDAALAAAALEFQDAIVRHKGLVEDDTLDFYRRQADRLFGMDAITDRDRLRRAGIDRRDRILDGIDLRALERETDRKHVRRTQEVHGERFDYWIASVPRGPDERAGRLLLVLDGAAFDRDLDERIARFGAEGLSAHRVPAGENWSGDGVVVASRTLQAPFDDIAVALVASNDGVIDGLTDLESAGTYYLFLVIIGLSILGITAAAVVTLRTVSGELKLAKRTSDFVQNVSHELKTPLTAIRVFVETLQDGRVRDDEERQECLAVIAKETDRLQERIERVLQFAKLEAGRVSFERRAADLGPVLREAAETFRSRLGDRPDAVFHEQLDDGLGPVRFDRLAIEEAVMNLLANGKKYSPPDRCELTLAATRENGAVKISVTDRGIGLPASERGRIFDKFYRVDDRRVQEVEGTGLGLALVRDIVEAHHGRIAVESRPGEGSTFTIHLPLATDDVES